MRFLPTATRECEIRAEVGAVLGGLLFYLSLCTASVSHAQSVRLNDHDATVWSQTQTVEGRFEGLGAAGVLHVDATEISFEAVADSFSVPIHLGAGSHRVYACGEVEQKAVCSDTLRLTLGFEPGPEVFTRAEVDDRTVTLRASLIEGGGDGPLSFKWTQDPDNPSPTPLTGDTDSVATLTITGGMPVGEYFYTVEVTDGNGATGSGRTFVTATDSTLVPFDIWSDHASWIDSAIVYEVTPYNFVPDGGLQDVREHLSEFDDLGINTLWIQPVFQTCYGGQGYDISNYFKIRSDYGNAQTLRTLITVAHNLGMKVILDFAPNHTCIHHPYALDAMEYGAASHYYDFYQRELDDVRYSTNYHQRTDGLMTFTYYFWTDLVNLNYNNPEVRRWITEAGQYWIEEFDIDGYRIDAVWGVNARTPEAMQQWRFDLKRIKPEILLLGEDKATRPESFDKRFDVAYDWYPEEGWVSHWTWQYDYSPTSNPTIFKYPNAGARSGLLRDALTNRGEGFAPGAKVFRFMENNDTFRFAATHSPHALARTRMAATLLFTLPGVPMLYNGQEIGYPTHPYETYAIFQPNRSFERQDRLGLYPYYRYLTHMRSRFRALTLGDFEEVGVEPRAAAGRVYSFRRSYRQEHVLVAINMGDQTEDVSLQMSLDELDLPAAETYYLSSLTTGEHFTVSAGHPGPIAIELPAYSTDAFVIADAPIEVALPTSTAWDPVTDLDGETSVYPNPFSAQTTLRFALERSGRVTLSVYDLLGRLVTRLVDRELTAGDQRITFDGSELASGTYLYRLETQGRVSTGIMIKTQ